jgi:6-phosphogluconolactonase (cycloisomerase 2 family)
MATGTYADNSTQDITAAVTWSSSATGIATIYNAAGNDGAAHAVGVGTSTITAALGGVSATGALTVTAATLTAIAVTPANPSVPNGNSQGFVATGTYSDQTTQTLTTSATWSSSDTQVATVTTTGNSGGMASTGAVGSTTIAATQAGITGSTSLTVSAATLVSIAVTPANATVFIGSPQHYTVTGTYSDGSTQDLTASTSTVWTSSAPLVATETNANGSQGVLTPLTVGTTVVEARVGTLTATVTATVAIREYAYVSNAGGTANDISPYVVGNSGVLTPVANGAVSSGGIQPFAIGIDSARGNLYVTNIQSSNIQQFSVGANGTLTAGTTYTANLDNPAFLTFDNNHNYLYVANLNDSAQGPGSIAEYAIGAGGGLSHLASVSQGFFTPYDLTIDSGNRWLYVLGAFSGTVAQYSIGGNGALTYQTSITIPGGGSTAFIPEIIVLDPSGTHAFVTAQYDNSNSTPGEVMEYSIDQTTGNLTLVNTVAAEAYARSIALDPSGTHVYVANVYGNSISEYSVDPIHGLQLLTTISTGPGANPNTGSNPSALNLDPTGQYLYASLSGSDSVVEYSINSDGTLNLLGSTPTGAGSGPDWVATAN